MMSEKNCKLKKRKNVKQYWTLENGEIYYFSTYEPYPLPLIVNILNKMEDDSLMLEEENEQLRMRLLNYEQKNDNGGFQVWEVPPIPKGKRISFTTNDNGGD